MDSLFPGDFMQNTSVSQRLQSIDMLRGFIIIIMLVDHLRDTFLLHQQVSDPMDVSNTGLVLYLSRLLAHLCAPAFVFLTGLSAYLYGQKQQSRRAISQFLLARGIFLVVLEITVINFAWTFQFPPHKLFLQVIWAIGLSMIALSALIWLPRYVLAVIGLIIVAGHNLLDSIHVSEGSIFFIPWAILHDRVWVVMSDSFSFRTSYPVLPWIGVISLGYVVGPWFNKAVSASERHKKLICTGITALVLFAVLRFINCYGDKPWVEGNSTAETVMSFFNITKYPPSLLFLALTLGISLLLLVVFELKQHNRLLQILTVFGSVPLFFYILHLYVLRILYVGGIAIFGKNHGDYFGFNNLGQMWLSWIVLVVALYPLVKWFSNYKATHKHMTWLKYL